MPLVAWMVIDHNAWRHVVNADADNRHTVYFISCGCSTPLVEASIEVIPVTNMMRSMLTDWRSGNEKWQDICVWSSLVLKKRH